MFSSVVSTAATAAAATAAAVVVISVAFVRHLLMLQFGFEFVIFFFRFRFLHICFSIHTIPSSMLRRLSMIYTSVSACAANRICSQCLIVGNETKNLSFQFFAFQQRFVCVAVVLHSVKIQFGFRLKSPQTGLISLRDILFLVIKCVWLGFKAGARYKCNWFIRDFVIK